MTNNQNETEIRKHGPKLIYGIGPNGCWKPGDLLHTGKIVAVERGDSLSLRMTDGLDFPRKFRDITLRLAGTWCPGDDEPFFAQARGYTADYCLGRTVTIFSRRHPLDDDKCLTGFLLIDEDRCLNLDIIRDGLAFWDNRKEPTCKPLEHWHKRARADGLGMWDRRKMQTWPNDWLQHFNLDRAKL